MREALNIIGTRSLLSLAALSLAVLSDQLAL
jgi:hypothetical protein